MRWIQYLLKKGRNTMSIKPLNKLPLEEVRALVHVANTFRKFGFYLDDIIADILYVNDPTFSYPLMNILATYDENDILSYIDAIRVCYELLPDEYKALERD